MEQNPPREEKACRSKMKPAPAPAGKIWRPRPHPSGGGSAAGSQLIRKEVRREQSAVGQAVRSSARTMSGELGMATADNTSSLGGGRGARGWRAEGRWQVAKRRRFLTTTASLAAQRWQTVPAHLTTGMALAAGRQKGGDRW